MKTVSGKEFLDALLAAPRPGAENILAFYDSRAGAICTDPRFLLLPLDDHICHRGDGLFESICFQEKRIFALDAHLERMAQSAALLGLEPPCSFDQIGDLACEVAKAGGSDRGDLRIFLSRGPGGFGLSPAECPATSLYIVALASRAPAPELYSKGLSAFRSSVPPKQDYLARIKNTSYLPNVFMAREAAGRKLDVAVSFDSEGNLGEAAVANVGIIDREGTLRSPDFEKILPGTTLLAALRLAQEKMPVKTGPVHESEIADCREMLLFTSATLCVPITSFDGRPVGNGTPGPVAGWLREALLENFLAAGRRF